MQVDPELARSLEEQLTRDLEAPEGSDEGSCSEGEGEDQLAAEWEAVSILCLISVLCKEFCQR